MKTILFFTFIAIITIHTRAQTESCSFLTINGGKILAEGAPNLLQINRGNEYTILSYDFNQDGKLDDISYWISTSLGEQKILSSLGQLLEEVDFYKQENSMLCVYVVKTPNEKFPLLIIYYNGSNNDDYLESTLYVFKQKEGEFYNAYQTNLSYGVYPDTMNFETMKIEDSYGSGGLYDEYDLILK